MTNNDTNVESREVLHKGAIVLMKLPKHLMPGSISIEGAEDIHYLQYSINLPGGMVNVFVRSNDESLAGRTIYAQPEICLKTLKNKRKFIYIDLHLVKGYKQITNRLVVMDNTFSRRADWQVFETPGMSGFVALIGAEEKLAAPGSERFRLASADPQLYSLLLDGWKIVGSKSGPVVKLDRLDKSGKLKKMTHHRPRIALT